MKLVTADNCTQRLQVFATSSPACKNYSSFYGQDCWLQKLLLASVLMRLGDILRLSADNASQVSQMGGLHLCVQSGLERRQQA